MLRPYNYHDAPDCRRLPYGGHAIVASTTVARGSLGAIVRAFKSAVTKQINELRQTPGKPVWQRNYYDRIIRDDGELHRVRRNILSNPKRCTDASKPLHGE